MCVCVQAFFGNVFQVSITMWCVKRKGPLFVSIFHPLGVILAMGMGVIILGEGLYLGRYVFLLSLKRELLLEERYIMTWIVRMCQQRAGISCCGGWVLLRHVGKS